eukprot:5110530-Heterocapsa_arctica.AAC.1
MVKARYTIQEVLVLVAASIGQRPAEVQKPPGAGRLQGSREGFGSGPKAQTSTARLIGLGPVGPRLTGSGQK